MIRFPVRTRHGVVQTGRIPSPQSAMRAIRQRLDVIGEGFTTIDTPLAPRSKTLFNVYAGPRRLMLAVCLLDGSKAGRIRESLEVFFDLRRDGIGYLQYLFSPGKQDEWLTRHHLPYPECRSTAFPIPEPLRARWIMPETAAMSGGRSSAMARSPIEECWLFVEFDRRALFRETDPIGFNIGRIDETGEVSSWNHSSGHGLQAPGSFGRLYQTAPAIEWTLRAVERRGRDLAMRGDVNSGGRRPILRWIDSCNQTRDLEVDWTGRTWRAVIKGAVGMPGRHRLKVELPDGRAIEPETIPFDVIASPRDVAAKIGVTYDFNVNVRRAPAYTPEALDAEMRWYARHGVGRIYWIDFNFFPGLRKTSPLVRQGERQCGPFLPLAAKLAKQRGLDFYGIFKPFDLLWNEKGTGPAALPLDAKRRRTNTRAPEAEARAFQHAVDPRLTMARPADVPRTPAGPIRRIEFFSITRLPPIKRSAVRIWVSQDAVRWRPYRGPFQFHQGRVRRPHCVWTAAGNRKTAGSAVNWRLLLDDLRLDAPYAAVTFQGATPCIRHRAHAIAAASDDQGEIPVIPANTGTRKTGFNFWTEWPSWANRSVRMLETLQWDASREPALAFRIPDRLPSWVEPACDAAHELWMYGVDRMCATEADGISIRTLCHHKAAFDLLMYAQGPDVRRRFQQAYGREPGYDADDAERVRRIRGDAYSEFVQTASQHVRSAGKRFSMHFEAGIEVPPSMDQRMQFDLQWERWIQEGWLDEIVLKWWFAQNPFVHERILPAARRAGVKVWLSGRNGSLRRTPRCVEYAAAIAREAREAGFAGFSFYEAADFMQRNVENVPEFHDQVGAAFAAAAAQAAPTSEDGCRQFL